MAERQRFRLPLVVFSLTFSGLVLFSAIQEHLRTRGGSPSAAVPAPLAAGTSVAGWRGPAALEADGLRLRLAPLHSEPTRQSFDARRLGSQLGLPQGQPFRLEIGASSDALAKVSVLGLDAGGKLWIEDDRGVAARLLVDAVGEVADGMQPILNVFQPARTLDLSEGTGRLVLWGRPPGKGAHVVTSGSDWKLTASEFERAELPLFVASVSESPKRSQ